MINRKHLKYPPPQTNQRNKSAFPKLGMCLIALLSFVLMSVTVFGQGANASLSGTIADASQGVLPGAAVTATNIDTGVEIRTTGNDRGIYNFPSLPPGTYNVTVDVPGFLRAVRTNVRLNVGGQASLNIEMAVAGTVTEVSVTGTVESVVLDAGASTGTVFEAQTLLEIPLVGSTFTDVINMMAGVVPTSDPINNPAGQTFAGVSASGINLTRDGMSINEVRWGSGITGNSNVNQEVVGEFKMVLSAVDAEMGRGSGQVQMTTRSGSNAFHGSGVWNVQNTYLDSREFDTKRRGQPPDWRNLNDYIVSVSGPIFKNRTFFFASWQQQFDLEKQVINSRSLTPCARKGIYRYIGGVAPVFEDGVQTGWANDGWMPGNLVDRPSFGTTRSRPSVKADGTPLVGPTQILNPANGQMVSVDGTLHFESIFGDLTPANRALLADPNNPGGAYGDCSALVFNGPSGNFGVTPNSYWGTGIYTSAWDQTGYIQNFTNGVAYSAGTTVMPPVNNYDMGDGLNIAGHRWVYGARGIMTIYNTGGDAERKSISLKIDHNINNDHRVSGTWNWEKSTTDMAQQQWPNEYGGYSGISHRYPQNFMFSLTSTLRPTLLNEARFGYTSQDSYTEDALHGKNASDMESVLLALMPTGAGTAFGGTPFQDRRIMVFPGDGSTLFSTDSATKSHPWSTRIGIGTAATWGGTDYRVSFADTITWLKGAHSFKGGVDFRYQQSYQNYTGVRAFNDGGALIDMPSVTGGITTATNQRRQRSAPLGTVNAECLTLAAGGVGPWCGVVPGASDGTSLAGNYSLAYQMMTYFAGSINHIRQYFYLNPATMDWNDITKGEEMYEYQPQNKEFSFFFKDDWKVTSDLTLNLGVRYEYYGVPYNWNGWTPSLKGSNKENVFGLSKDAGWTGWMNNRPYVYDDPGPITIFEYVGPGSPNPDRSAWNKDMNNFAPHVGFAWQLPWFGKGLTTLRGGYSISYMPVDSFDQYGIRVASVSGTGQDYTMGFYGSGATTLPAGGSVSDRQYDSNYYMDFTDLARILPMRGYIPEYIRPMTIRENGQFYAGATIMDEDIRNPMVHSLNMSLTRNIGRALTVDVRYIGTLSRNQTTSTNVNSINYIDNLLYKELNEVRMGNESMLINSLIPQNPDSATGGFLYNSANATGSAQLRLQSAANLGRGNFNSVASTLSTTNGQLTTADPLQQGLIARAGCLPDDRPGYAAAFASNPLTNVNNFPCSRPTPWNYFVSNPQYSGPSITYNGALTNYHSMQAQVTLRPVRGLNFQATYTWSRMIGNSGWSNYLGDRFNDRDYYLSGSNRSHALNTYGSYTLPFGRDGFFFRDASGAFKKAIEGWQISWITAMSSGGPMSISGNSTMWGNSNPILVRPDLWDNKAGSVDIMWSDDGQYVGANYFGQKYTNYVVDPLCDSTVQGYNANREKDPNDPHTGLFKTYCSATNYIHPTSGGELPIPASGVPRALALSSGITVGGNTLPALYESDYTAADGVTYKAGDPIIVFRQADQRLGANAAGDFRPNQLTGVGRLSFDLAMSKSIEFMEGKRLEIRVDAQNILNHPTPSNSYSTYAPSLRNIAVTNPSVGLGTSDPFGYIMTKVGRRTFQGKIRLSF